MFNKVDIFYDEANRCYQVRTKASCYVIEFDDPAKTAIFEALIDQLRDDNSQVLPVARKLRKQHDPDQVIEVLATLNDHELVPYEQRREVEEFTGRKSPDADASEEAAAADSCSTASILVLGDGDLAIKVATKLRDDYREVKHQVYADFPARKQEILEEKMEQYDFFVLDGSRWNPEFTERFNRLALKYNKPWLYVGGVEEINIKVGPIFYGKETGCYNCLVKRIKSNVEHLTYFNGYEDYLRRNGVSGQPDQLPQNDLYLDLAANVAALEIGKFFNLWAVPSTWKAFISINALDYSTSKHNLLKIPFCEVCKPELVYNPAPWLEPISVS